MMDSGGRAMVRRPRCVLAVPAVPFSSCFAWRSWRLGVHRLDVIAHTARVFLLTGATDGLPARVFVRYAAWPSCFIGRSANIARPGPSIARLTSYFPSLGPTISADRSLH